ncbi:MAG: response regulator transcription factor [Clostridiaceae bacterium]
MDKILIIEDEEKIARFIQLELIHEGYEVKIEGDGRSGLNTAVSENFSLILLDVMLPSLNGMEVLRRIRQDSQVPVIMLTAKDEITDKVMGLDLGADDYITKPFAIEELLARIRVSLKRNRSIKPKENIIKSSNITLNLDNYSVYYKDEKIELTKTEFEFLRYLMENEDIVLTRDKILDKVWGYDYLGDTNVVDVYVRYLRSKLDDKYNIKLIHTVRGVGYLFKNEDI